MRKIPHLHRLFALIFAVGLMLSLISLYGCGEIPTDDPSSSSASKTSKTRSPNASDKADENSIHSVAADSVPSAPSKGKPSSLPDVSSTSSSHPTTSSSEIAPMKPVSSTKWKQKEFYLSGFITWTTEGSLRSAKEAGLNLVEFAFSNSEEVERGIKICDKIGLNCLPFDRGRWTVVGGNVPLFNDNAVYSWISEFHAHKSLIGYYLWDEVMQNAFLQAKGLQSLFRKYDPARLAYLILHASYMYHPWNAGDTGMENSAYYKYVDNFLKTVQPDVLSFNYYPLVKYSSLIECDWWRDMGLMRAKAIEYNIPFWYYYQASELGSKPACTVPEMKIQMYAGLAYGAKYLSAFNSAGRMYTVDGRKAADFTSIQQNNHEIMTVGRFLFNKKDHKIYHTGLSRDTLTGPYFLDKFQDSEIIRSAPGGLIISIFRDEHTAAQYMLIVNKNYSASKAGDLELKSKFSIGFLNKTSGNVENLGTSNSIALNLAPGDGELYVIQ